MGTFGYYRYLAARLPPQRLLATAARKAIRAARGRLPSPPLAPPPGDLLQSMEAADPAALAELLRAGPHLPLGAAAHLPALPEALDRWFPGEREAIRRRAAEAREGRLAIFGSTVDVAAGNGGTRWRLAHPDIKRSWALGRGEQWVLMACAGAAHPAERAAWAEAIARSLRDFLEQNRPGTGLHWSSPMEVALRALNAALAHALLRNAPPLAAPTFALDLCTLLVASGRFVLRHLEDDTPVPNNHLAANWLGLLACALTLPQWPEAARWRSLAERGLDDVLLLQTHPDGATFEGSVPYHRLALEIFAMATVLRGGAPPRLASMFRAARSLLFQNGELPQIGDNDSGRTLPFRPRGALDGSHLPPLGAALLGRPEWLLHPAPAGCEEVLWLLGPPALARLLSARPGPAPGDVAFPGAGFFMLRRDGLEAAVSAGPNGQRGVGGHSHNDKLAFELRCRGRLVICDGGSPGYTGDPRVRDAFRSTRAHATVMVDGEEQSPLPSGRPFALPDMARAEGALLPLPQGHAFAGSHRGYRRLGVIHRRWMALLHGVALVDDLLEGDPGREHHFALHMPLPDEQARVRIPSADGKPIGWRAIELGPAHAPVAWMAITAPPWLQLSLEPALYSPGYGQTRPSLTVTLAGRGQCPLRIATAIIPWRTS
jgi:hypothetical protein